MGPLRPSTPSTARRADVGAVLAALALPTLFTWVYFVLIAEAAVTLQQSVSVLAKTIQFGFPLVWVLAIQRRRLRWKKPGADGLPEGLLFGLLILAGALLLYHQWLKPAGYLEAAREAIGRKLEGYGLASPARYVAFAAFLSVAHSFLEEYYWRWFVFGQLRRLIPPPAAIVVSSLGFMSHHVIVLSVYFGWLSWPTVVFSLAVAVGGAVWAGIYHRSGSLYGPWLSHLLADVAIMAIGYDVVRPWLYS